MHLGNCFFCLLKIYLLKRHFLHESFWELIISDTAVFNFQHILALNRLLQTDAMCFWIDIDGYFIFLCHDINNVDKLISIIPTLEHTDDNEHAVFCSLSNVVFVRFLSTYSYHAFPSDEWGIWNARDRYKVNVKSLA